MNEPKKIAKRIAVGLIGFPLFAAGIILIPLPGPGLLLSFVALFILSTEFSWATKRFKAIKAKIRQIYKEAKERADKIENMGKGPGKKDR